ncbi:MAG TPA: hypothetical protein VFO73_00525 [Candidatus Limnocylindrales bacterium]|nr:hypothetical protein [Candidatus Limnocylindrales bacterium]
MDNFATWMMNGGRDPMETPSERDLFHRRALRDARAAAGDGRTSVLARLAASLRSSFRTEDTIPSDAACCAA